MTFEECYNAILNECRSMLEGHIDRSTEPPILDTVGALTVICGCVAICRLYSKAIWSYKNDIEKPLKKGRKDVYEKRK